MCTSEDIADCLHGESLLCSLNEQRMQGFLCDVTIVVEDTKFKAHRNILAASSLYFRNQFRSQSILIQGHVLELADFKADTFTEILNFIYSSKIAVKKKETLTDLADAGKRLGISFLENIKTSKKSSAVVCSADSEKIQPPTFYQEQNGMKSETVDKKGDDPAIASGPRITNAFSILETEVNGFSPLDLRSNFKKSTDPAEEVHDGSNCENGVCSDGEPVNTLAEHSYAVSSGDSQYKRDSVFDHGSKLDHTNETESTTPGTVPTIKETTSAIAMPVLETQSFVPQTIIQSCASSDSVSCSTEQPANSSNVYGQKEDENLLTQLPPNNPPVQQPFSDTGLYPLPKRFQDTFNCKNCSKGFAHFKRLQRHEQICFKMVHIDKDVRLSSSHSQDTSSDAASDQNSLSYGSSSGTDHFVKIVEGKIFYVCIVCKRNYLTLSSLRRHSNVHSWRKSYPCHYCNKVFALAEYRTKHEIWHTGDRRYQCIFCLETFMTYYILKNHQKSSHGIDPRLGVGNKANNRGLKSSIYPYKLYRLLPMKCKRAPLKSSTNDSAELPGIHFQGNSTFNTATIDQNTLSSQPFALEGQERFSCTVNEPAQSVASSTTAQDSWPFHILQSEKDASVLPAGKCNSPSQVLDSTPKDCDKANSPLFSEKVNNPSVISTSNVAPSVIMHSSRVSSVIMHGNAVTGTTAATNGIGWNHAKTIVSPEREDIGKGTEPETAEARATREEQWPDRSRVGESCQEGRELFLPATSTKKNKSGIREGNKTETYIAKPALPGTLVNSGIAPLCQITVKIGSEALVKRQISGSSLFFRKSGRPKHSESRSERAWLDADDKKERSSNRLRRSESVKMEEMCDDTSDQDVSDKPWRPYYNYKPKKKSKHFKKFRKLKKRKKHSRSKSVEENLIEAETKCTSGEADEENENEIENEGDNDLETEDIDCPETTAEEEMETTDWHMDNGPCFCELCQKSFRNPSTLKVHMRCHTGEKPYACKTCGKCFSFPGNLNKHERIHLGVRNFMCQYCSKSFMLHETLKKHERIHTGEKTYDCQFCSQQFLYLCTKNNHEQRHLAERSVKGFVCVHCSKICKTAAAFGMHKKKHYLRGLKNRENKDVPTPAVEKESNVDDERSSKNESESLPPFDDCKAPLLSFNSTEVNPLNVNAASLVENVNEFGETENHFLTPPPPPPTGLHSSVLVEAPKGWKYWKTRQYKLEESLNSDQSSLKESTKTFTELKTMTNFETPFIP